jgi:hypothetical protein
MGIRDKRVSIQEIQELMDEFMNKKSIAFPNIMIHFRLAKNMLNVSIVMLIWNALFGAELVCQVRVASHAHRRLASEHNIYFLSLFKRSL